MPYPQARGVMRLRAKSHGGVFVAMANARTPQSQWENTVPGYSGDPSERLFHHNSSARLAAEGRHSLVRWLIAMNLRFAEPVHRGARSAYAVRVLSKALESGPVLLSIPQDSVSETLSCAKCHRQARCAKCPDHCNSRPTAGIPHRDAAGVGLLPSIGSARAVGMNVCAWCVWGLPALRRSWPDRSVACQ